ncbi:hypothetical protein ACFQ3Z_04770 [Streptomyces nogalater]
MHAVIVWWDLGPSRQTIESLRDFLRDEAVDRFSRTPGLRLKFWISDEATDRWGRCCCGSRARRPPLPCRTGRRS